MLEKIKNIFKSTSGQSTVEFAIVTAALLIIILALGSLWNLADKGIFIEHAQSCSSHNLQDCSPGNIGDVFSC